MNDARTPLAIENESSDGNQIKNVTSSTADNISVCYYLEEKVRDLNTMKHRFNILPDQKEENYNLPTISMLQQQDQIIAPVAKVSFENFIVTIFTDTDQKRSPRQFYFEPLVLLDSNSIITESNAFLKQEFVRFTVQMWNQQMRSKILNRLRSLPSLNSLVIQEDDVHVMPYKEVQLLFKPNPNGWHHRNDSIQLFNEPTPYNTLRETLDFYLLCDSAITADMLAADLRHNPGSTLNGLQLVMECRGLVLVDFCSNSAVLKKHIVKFNLSTNNSHKDDDEVTVAHLSEMTAVPVFGVSVCSVQWGIDESFSFEKSNFETKFEYGTFILKNGMFTANAPGLYQFHFSALQKVSKDNHFTNIELRVDGVKKAEFLSQLIRGKEEYEPISLSSTLTLKQGQKVGVFLAAGKLYTASPSFPTQFSAIFFSD